MAKTILTDAGYWLGQFELSGSMNSIAIEGTAETRDCTTFGDPFRTYLVGPKNANVSAAGFLDAPIDANLFSKWGLTGETLTIGAARPAGNVAFVGKVFQGQYSPNMTYGEAWAYTSTAILSERSFARGRIMHNGVVTATGNGTIIQLRGITAGKSAFATMHVMNISGTATPTITGIVQSDDAIGFTTPVQRGPNLGPRTTVGANTIEIPGPVTPDTFWRMGWTITGTTPSFTIVMALGFEEPV